MIMIFFLKKKIVTSNVVYCITSIKILNEIKAYTSLEFRPIYEI